MPYIISEYPQSPFIYAMLLNVKKIDNSYYSYDFYANYLYDRLLYEIDRRFSCTDNEIISLLCKYNEDDKIITFMSRDINILCYIFEFILELNNCYIPNSICSCSNFNHRFLDRKHCKYNRRTLFNCYIYE